MSDSNLPKPFAVVIGAVTSIIAFVTAIVGFVLLWQGNAEIVSAVVIGVGLLGLWGSMFYIRFTKKIPKKDEKEAESKHKKGNKKPRFIFSYTFRRAALIGIYTLPILTLLGIGSYYYKTARPNNEIVILVADFDGADPQKYGVTQFLVEKIKDGISTLHDVRVVLLNDTIVASQDSNSVFEIAQKIKANIIIWGWYVASDTGINVTYHVIRMDFDTGFGATTPYDFRANLTAPIEQVNTFDFQSKQLADNIVFDTQRSIFHAFTRNNDYDNASLVVNAALDYLQNHQDSFNNYKEAYSKVLATRAAMDFEKYGYDKSLETANEAILTYPSYDAYLNRASIHSATGNYQLALDDLFQAVKIPVDYTEKHTDAYILIGKIYNKQSNYEEAVKIYTQALSEIGGSCTIMNGCHILHYNRGIDYLAIGDKNNAEKDFEIVKNVMNDPDVSKQLDLLLEQTP